MLSAKVHVIINPLFPEHLFPHRARILVDAEIVWVLEPIIEGILGDVELSSSAIRFTVRLKRILLPVGVNTKIKISNAH